MNKLKLFKVIDLIDEDLIKEAEITDKNVTNSESRNNITVSGVDIYHENKWHRIAAIAASFLLIVGIGAGGALLFRNSNKVLTAEDHAVPSDISSTDAASPFERVTDRESAATEPKETEKATKESSDISAAVTAAVKDENKPTVTTDLDPMYAEVYLVSQTQNNIPAQTQGTGIGICGLLKENSSYTEPVITQETGVEDFIKHAQEFPIVTSPDGSKKPIATKPANIEEFINQAQDFPEVTSADGSQKTIAPKPIVDDPDGFANFDIFESLASLHYSPDTCDGIPEYWLLAPDGTWYSINLSSSWIWRKAPDHPYAQPPEEAYLTKTQLSYLRQHGEEIGMRPAIFGN